MSGNQSFVRQPAVLRVAGGEGRDPLALLALLALLATLEAGVRGCCSAAGESGVLPVDEGPRVLRKAGL